MGSPLPILSSSARKLSFGRCSGVCMTPSRLSSPSAPCVTDKDSIRRRPHLHLHRRLRFPDPAGTTTTSPPTALTVPILRASLPSGNERRSSRPTGLNCLTASRILEACRNGSGQSSTTAASPATPSNGSLKRPGNSSLPRCLTGSRSCLGASMACPTPPPPPRYPFGWHELKARMEARTLPLTRSITSGATWPALSAGGTSSRSTPALQSLPGWSASLRTLPYTARACGTYTMRKCRPQSSIP